MFGIWQNQQLIQFILLWHVLPPPPANALYRDLSQQDIINNKYVIAIQKHHMHISGHEFVNQTGALLSIPCIVQF